MSNQIPSPPQPPLSSSTLCTSTAPGAVERDDDKSSVRAFCGSPARSFAQRISDDTDTPGLFTTPPLESKDGPSTKGTLSLQEAAFKKVFRDLQESLGGYECSAGLSCGGSVPISSDNDREGFKSKASSPPVTVRFDCATGAAHKITFPCDSSSEKMMRHLEDVCNSSVRSKDTKGKGKEREVLDVEIEAGLGVKRFAVD